MGQGTACINIKQSSLWAERAGLSPERRGGSRGCPERTKKRKFAHNHAPRMAGKRARDVTR